MMACSVPVKAQNPATQTITLSDGARYTGQVLRGKPNGKGKASIRMATSMRESFSRASATGRAPTHSRMERNIRANGFRTTSTVWATTTS